MNEGNMLMEDIIIMLGIAFNLNLPLLTAWLLDHWLGDPVWLPHPVVAFGKAISFCEHRLNNGNARFLKGAAMSLALVAGVYFLTLFLLRRVAHYSPGLLLALQSPRWPPCSAPPNPSFAACFPRMPHSSGPTQPARSASST